MRLCPSGHRVQSGTRCAACSRRRESGRPSRQARGYGAAHDAARRSLVASAAPCGYCGKVIEGAFVAAHVIDGRPEYGWMRAHPVCNERAKGSTLPVGRSEDFGTPSGAVPAPRLLAPRPGFSPFSGDAS